MDIERLRVHRGASVQIIHARSVQKVEQNLSNLLPHFIMDWIIFGSDKASMSAS
jgi:hypothetical protein